MNDDKWAIRFYKTSTGSMPVRNFLDSLPNNVFVRVSKDIELLVRFGNNLGPPKVINLRGKDNRPMLELRTKTHDLLIRILFVFKGKEIILMHGFAKKTDETPSRELNQAKTIMRKILNDWGEKNE